MEILAVGAALIQAERRKDGRKDMTKMICAFSDYGNALKNELLYRILSVIYEKLCLFRDCSNCDLSSSVAARILD